MQVDVENIQREKVGTIDVPDEIFMAEISPALLWEQVKAQRASKRQGTHKTRGRSEVQGGGAKPFKQKGTCLLYTSPSPRDKRQSRMPSSA